jgi:hypothetical protein
MAMGGNIGNRRREGWLGGEVAFAVRLGLAERLEPGEGWWYPSHLVISHRGGRAV